MRKMIMLALASFVWKQVQKRMVGRRRIAPAVVASNAPAPYGD
jgi:hypothetical protein